MHISTPSSLFSSHNSSPYTLKIHDFLPGLKDLRENCVHYQELVELQKKEVNLDVLLSPYFGGCNFISP